VTTGLQAQLFRSRRLVESMNIVALEDSVCSPDLALCYFFLSPQKGGHISKP
jgi:hypothetical protein